MRLTFLLVGVAAAAAFLTDDADAHRRQPAQDVMVIDSASGGEAEVYRNDADRAPAESDYRGRWQGEWQGQWHDAQGRVYEGSYDGTYDARGDAQGVGRGVDYDGRGAGYAAPAPVRQRVDSRAGWSEADWAQRCRRDNGVGGAVIGGVVGAVAGNRIAGRGNRTAGTLIGGGVGALAGLAIDRAEDNRGCDGYWRDHNGGRADGGYDRRVVRRYSRDDARYSREDGRYVNGYGYDHGYSDGGSSGSYQSSGYGSDVVGYAPGATTTIIVPGQPVIIEETETFYETVTTPAVTRYRVAPRRVIHRPRVRARCTCR